MENDVGKNVRSSDEIFKKDFLSGIIKSGRLTTLIAGLLTFLPALYLWLGMGIKPTWAQIGLGWLNIVSIYAIIYVVEPISYYPVLGLSGIYIGYLAGNVPSVRLPSLMAAQAATESEAGTNRGEVVGTIAMGSSVFVNIFFVTLAALAGNYILGILPDFVISSFAYTLPAILGGVMAQFMLKHPSFVVIILALAIPIQLSSISSAFKFPLIILLSFIVSYMLYQYKKKSQN